LAWAIPPFYSLHREAGAAMAAQTEQKQTKTDLENIKI
jgi:hypothetical protein